jgi:uncharacterized protein
MVNQKTNRGNPSKPTDISPKTIIAQTQSWIEKAVIGLSLCPFAKTVYVKEQIRYVVSGAKTPEALLPELEAELQFLIATDSNLIDTTLLIHPEALTDFLDYNVFLKTVDGALAKLKLVGEKQIASFHPQYQFSGTGLNDIENYTNRSPYPMLHLLREASVERAIASFPDAAGIADTNIETLRKLGLRGWQDLKI